MSRGLCIDLLIIDPQNDFCDQPRATLGVPGACNDLKRLSNFVARTGNKLNDIHVTLDSHHLLDIANPMWFKSIRDEIVAGKLVPAGSEPAPFTLIKPEDIDPTSSSKKWTTTIPEYLARTVAYLKALYANGRYPHVIWPPHCLIGSWGTAVYEQLFEALVHWEKNSVGFVDYVTKGSNIWTEHFSAVQAEVPDSTDPSTQLNTTLIEILERCDQILIAGEALSHCVANTVRDISNNFKDKSTVNKIILLEDCSSNVTGFEKFGEDFLRDMKVKGMQVVKSTEYMQTSAKIPVTI